MRVRRVLFVAAALGCCHSSMLMAQDAVKVDPKHYTVEFENDRVKVVRIRLGKHEKAPVRARKDRVIIWLTDSLYVRTESSGNKEEFRRKAGDVAWRSASEHQVENLGDGRHEVIIVELKK